MDEKLGDISAWIEQLPEKSLKNFSKKRVSYSSE
jgi:hypothetical protein